MSREARQEPVAQPPTRSEHGDERSVREARARRRAAGDEEAFRRRGCHRVGDLLGDYSEQTGANFG